MFSIYFLKYKYLIINLNFFYSFMTGGVMEPTVKALA